MATDVYAQIRKRYPPQISKDQLYVICRISKRSAKYLLDNGIIPCINTGKKTHRYKIDIEDVIAYLKKRKKKGTMIPRGAVSSRSKGPRVSYSSTILQGQEDEVRRYFQYIYAEFPDMLNSFDLTEMTGLSRKTMLEMLKRGDVQSLFVNNRYMVPKEYMLNFVVSPKFLDIKSNSEDFKRILGGFEAWKKLKS